MTAVVILNVIGATLMVAAISSLLAWAIHRERRAQVTRQVWPPVRRA